MKNLVLVLGVFWGLFAADSASAAITLNCVPFDAIDQDTFECEDNGKFTQAGKLCLNSLEQAIKNQSDQAAKALAASNAATAAAGNNQKQNFVGAKSGYGISESVLKDLEGHRTIVL